MIHFKSCKWENFLSTGSDPITIQLDRTPSTLIVGQNGAGKSTLLDALSFGLFGKPHRDIGKMQLVNSINNKKTVVEVEFTVGDQDFKIVRGIKPNRFEIWQNGNMTNQASNMRDYQKYLETNILKLNHKSFHQVVVLGSSSFIPFMQLPAWSRRAVIEDLLDINIFSKMNTLLKERNSVIRDQLTDINHQIDLLNTKIDSQTKYINNLEALNQDQIEGKRDSIETHKNDIDEIFRDSKELGKNLSVLITEEEKNHKHHVEKMSEVKSMDKTLNDKIKTLVGDARFYEENDNCPTCEQEITEEIKDDKISKIKISASDVQEEMQGLRKEIKTTEQEGRTIANHLNELRQRQNRINSNNDKIALLQKEIDKIQKEINTLTSQSGDSGQAKKELSTMRRGKQKSTENKLQYVEERTYNEVIGEMLKDTGIKTKVIKQY